MKQTKRILSVLLAVLMLAVSVPEAFTASASYAVGDHIQFGTYPQTRVDETPALKKAAEDATWRSYGYYSGTGEENDGLMRPGDWMQFADFFSGGVKFRAVTFTQYRPALTFQTTYNDGGNYSIPGENGYQDVNGYELNTVYYFRFEPLTWRILDPRTGYVMCEKIIDNQAFQNITFETEDNIVIHDGEGIGDKYTWQGIGSTIYANEFSASSVNRWLNLDFYETAFTSNQKKLIVGSEISLLSLDEAKNSSYGFLINERNTDEARCAYGTDYAKCQGLNQNSFGSIWFLKTAVEPYEYYTSYEFKKYRYGGEAYAALPGGSCYRWPVENSVGIRPVCKLSKLISETTISCSLYSSGSVAHSAATAVIENEVAATAEKGGSYDEVIYCSICGTEISRKTISTEPLEPELPTEPTDDKPTDEKPAEKLNFFQRIIQWFRNFFAKLFGR